MSVTLVNGRWVLVIGKTMNDNYVIQDILREEIAVCRGVDLLQYPLVSIQPFSHSYSLLPADVKSRLWETVVTDEHKHYMRKNGASDEIFD